MILLFLKQNMSWIAFIIIVQVLLNFILMIDVGFTDVSLIYFNLVWSVGLILFLSWRYFEDRKKLQTFEVTGNDYIEVVREAYEHKLRLVKTEAKQQSLDVLNYQDELLAWVHEMKAPMTSLQLLMDRVEQTDTKERLQAEWLRLYLLLDQQLHATRLRTMEQDNRLEECNLEEVLIEEIKALKSWCFEKKIAIDLQDVELEIITDRKWLAFIIRQIISNAVKYSPVGGEISIYTIVENEKVELLIKDEGVGIKKEDLPRVFRKSYTGTIGRETSAATGMGLYLAKQAASHLNIKLSIDSIENEGTTVKIQFPSPDEYYQTLA